MPISGSSKSSSRHGALRAVPYEDIKAGKPPIPITVAPPPPSSARLGVHPLLRPRTSPEPSLAGSTARSKLHDDVRRNSGLAPSSSTAGESRTTLATDAESAISIRQYPSLPTVAGRDLTIHPRRTLRKWSGQKVQRVDPSKDLSQPVEAPFKGITTNIPTSSFEDLSAPGKVEFSKRGSMLIGGKRAMDTTETANRRATGNGLSRKPSTSILSKPSTIPQRVISADDEMLSRKVRAMYENGVETERIVNQEKLLGFSNGKIRGNGGEDSGHEMNTEGLAAHLTVENVLSQSRTALRSSRQDNLIVREDSELAGGIEDWQDISGEDIDRYGFVVPRTSASANASSNSPATSPEQPRLQRVSTLLQLASETPRRQRSKLGRQSSNASSTNSQTDPSMRGIRPASSQGSYRSTGSRPVSRVRTATNRLPHNRDRRCVDEAGDMLTLPPGLADIAEHEEGDRTVDDLKRREWEREEKWRKMAKTVKKNPNGGGMIFEFDTKSPKVIGRTWKGIPDRWRATAWHSFLSASAKKRKGSPTDEELVSTFRELVQQSSPDDVQIDIDVPRTINSHIMFRRRYRGGQRLLFRVLHCLSVYFPNTGYVQGMAALAATFLCYFDEEMAFVMLVRMWQLRGLANLYQPGFDGLMEALNEFEQKWLDKRDVAMKLKNLGISPTAYGTRWYLTIFNYSIPFPAQLRVWDIFLLLGDADSVSPSTNTAPGSKPSSFNGSLDVLHAASAALIDGTREILLDSDFENAMKVLTSWIPIRDEELLMRVAKAEWKSHRRKQ